jgi:hypothetical protein
MLALATCGACSKGVAEKSDKRPAATASMAAKPATTTAIARNPCELITKQEVEEALGAPVREPRARGSACDFLPEGKRLSSVSYAVHWSGGREAMRRANRAETLVASFGDSAVQAEMKKMRERAAADLDGIGDEASFQLVTLHVRKGDAYVTIDARLCSRAQAIAVARKVVSRL